MEDGNAVLKGLLAKIQNLILDIAVRNRSKQFKKLFGALLCGAPTL